MKHDNTIEYTLYSNDFYDVAGSRAAARRKAKGWLEQGHALTRIERTIREAGTNRVINKVCCYTENGAM